jgi:hypothetical protein
MKLILLYTNTLIKTKSSIILSTLPITTQTIPTNAPQV